MAIIAISRQMGSGGYTIAASVAKALGYEYADRQMIVNAAKAYDVPEAAIAEVAECRLSAWQRFDAEKIRYRTFLDAAYFNIAEKDNLDHAKAVHKIRGFDRDVTARISYLFGPEWLLPENYDLVINTMWDDPALYADMVTAVASHPQFVATPASTQLVWNLSLAAQVRAAIAANRHTQSGVDLEVTADKGQVNLKGSVRHLSIRDAVLAVLKEVPGVQSVSSEEVTPTITRRRCDKQKGRTGPRSSTHARRCHSARRFP